MAEKRGYVYVAEDKTRPSVYKIGQTTNLAQRERSLQGGGADERIKIVESVLVNDMDAVEHAFHRILPNPMGREWFNITLDRVRPMFEVLRSLGPVEPKQRAAPQRSDARRVRGEWHEDGWKMHCEGVTQAAIAERFGVTQGAVVAMKRKMRNAGRGHEERKPPQTSRRKERSRGVTPVSSFHQPIIDVLKRLGGRARAKDVLSGIEEEMNLGRADLKKLGTGQVIWKNRAQWARQALKENGVLKPDSDRGWWELA